MALVTYVLGDCPGCKAQNSFGNVDIYGDYVSKGCKRCRYKERVNLPPLRKKVLYLDQLVDVNYLDRRASTILAGGSRE